MKTKVSKVVLSLLLSCLVLTSCQKNEVKPFIGDYTYNTSGQVILTMSGIPVQESLPNSTGQMHIIDIDEDNRVMIKKTSLTGSVSIGYATIDGDEITFEPTTTSESIFLGVQYGTAVITSTGVGKIYDDNTIVVYEKYNGTFAAIGNYLTVAGTIAGDSILTVATRNEKN